VITKLSGKWVCLVLVALADGSMRHSDLRKTLVGVSQKVLTQTLRELERDGLVRRQVTPGPPMRVDYELTSLGVGLLAVLEKIRAWADEHMERRASQRDA
jgi:DNA-binding HxlR family transcriptional regulator